MNKNKTTEVVSHILVWLSLFSMPYLLSYGQEQDIYRVTAHFWIPLVFSMAMFYFNYFLLIDQLLFPKKMVQFIVVNLALISLFIYLKESIEDHFFKDLIKRQSMNNGGKKPPFTMALYIQMVSYTAPLFFSIALKSTKRWNKTEAEHKEAANFKLKSELQHLHYQLQPHFFFNSLNNIYSLVDVSPEQAKSSIHSLSKLMRYMLYETNFEVVPLSKEIDFLKKYIDLMKLRISDKTAVNYNFPATETGIQIAPLLFISLIENAFKHGVSAINDSQIRIDMTCEGKAVYFSIKNTNFPKKIDDKSGSGIGLVNLEKRLELLYPGNFSFQQKIENGIFNVELKIETV